jgi:dUTP pyrophosphatase
MNPRLVYLAGPIDLATPELMAGGIETDRAAANRELTRARHVVYRPWHAFGMPTKPTPDHRVEAVNRAALANADAMVALLPAGVPTIGTPMEIEFAASQDIPVVVVTNIVRSSQALARHGVTVIRHIDLLVDTLDRVFKLREERLVRVANLPTAEGSELLFVSEVEPGDGGSSEVAPGRAYPDDAGLDLYVSVRTTIPVGQTVAVPAGIRMQLPPWAWGFITGRSSTLVKRRLMVQSAVIDTGYRGPLYAYVTNLGEETAVAMPGERLAQIIVMENSTRRVTVREVEELEPHDRGSNGFGSSGA